MSGRGYTLEPMAVLVQLSRGCWRTARGILDCLTSSGLVTCAELASKRAMAPVQCLCTSSQASAAAAGHTLRTLRTTPCVRGREIDGSRWVLLLPLFPGAFKNMYDVTIYDWQSSHFLLLLLQIQHSNNSLYVLCIIPSLSLLYL